jgi:hypothetical protein
MYRKNNFPCHHFIIFPWLYFVTRETASFLTAQKIQAICKRIGGES